MQGSANGGWGLGGKTKTNIKEGTGVVFPIKFQHSYREGKFHTYDQIIIEHKTNKDK